MIKKRIQNILIICLFAVIPTLLLWLPFVLKMETFWTIPLNSQGMATIVSNFDGPLYIVPAKTLYNPEEIGKNYQFPLSNEYYSAHFPLYPVLIRAFSYILGYPYAMLLVTILSSIAALYFFYKHARMHMKRKDALVLTAIFSIFPARWLIVRSIGSPEPLFMAAILSSTYFFIKGNIWAAGFLGMIAQVTKSPGILLFISYGLAIVMPHIKSLLNGRILPFLVKLEIKKHIPLLLIPVGLLLTFSLYFFRYGDFWTYFKSGDNIHLFFPPFQIFNYSAYWVGTYWLEEIIFIYAVGIAALFKLKKDFNNIYFYFPLVFFSTIFFISHRDILRYSLPAIPFFILAFKDILLKKEFKIIILILLVPIYLYSLAFISQNTMPISNWGPLL